MDNENFEIDDILNQNDLFKPITKGLGFHHSLKEKKEVSTSLKQKSLDLKADLEQRARELKQNKEELKSPKAINMGELAPFYEEKQQESISFHSALEPEVQVQLNNADYITRFVAWTIDMGFLLSVFMFSLVIPALLSGFDLNFTVNQLSESWNIAFMSLFFLALYCVYFLIFDKGDLQSIGKKMLRIKITAKSGKLLFSQKLKRSILLIPSILSFGIINLLKLDDKFSETEIKNLN